MDLSLIIITLNEADNIERCIRSVPFAKDIVVVDSGSTDNTKLIAQSLGARVFDEPWQGFGPQKRSAVAKAQNDWVLCLDADEALSPELSAEVQKKLSTLDPAKAYRIPRRSFYLNRWINHGGWYPDFQIRLFNRQCSNWNESPIHEKVESLDLGRLENDLHHWVFDNIADQVNTNNRYSSLQAGELDKNRNKFSAWKLLTKPWVKFVENYFWKQGFRDGMAGFIIAVSSGYSVFLKWAKLWERQKHD